MTDPKNHTDMASELDALFDLARSSAPEPSSDLLSKIMLDAETIGAETVGAHGGSDVSMPTLWERISEGVREALGGWQGLAGVATAGLAGLMIGLGSPDALSALTLGLSDSSEVVFDETADTSIGLDSILTSFDGLGAEG